MNLIEEICSNGPIKPWDQLHLNLIKVENPKLGNILRNLNPKVLFFGPEVLSRCFYERPYPLDKFPLSKYSGDVISMIQPKFFYTIDEFKQTLLHELCHWTEVRCLFDILKTPQYTEFFSELVCDVSTYWLCNSLDIKYKFFTRPSECLQEWNSILKNDVKSLEHVLKISELITNFLLRNAQHVYH